MVFLDANILIELIVPGRAHYDQVRKLLGNHTEVQTSMLSVHLCWHFGRQAGVSDDLIAAIIDSCTLIALEPNDYYWARESEQAKDFEDALQLACALRTNCKQFMTLDKNLIKNYAGYIEFITV